MTIFNTLPYTLTNGQTADATQVMANLNQIINNGNTGCAASGINADITEMTALTQITSLTTPLSVAQGGTGLATGFMPSGTLAVFPQAIAPTGWTQSNTFNDQVLRFVDNTETGGATGGTWTISGNFGSTDGHAVTINEMPSHAHGTTEAPHTHLVGSGNTITPTSGALDGAGAADVSSGGALTGLTINNNGGGAAHSHPLTSISSDGAWRPAYVNSLVASKD